MRALRVGEGGASPAPTRAVHSEPSPLGAQESCSQRCGDPGGQCSCHPTCSGLGTCCSDLRDFCLEVVPHSGSMMGGKDFVVQHLKWSSPTTSVICRWGAKGPCILGARTTWLAGRSPEDQGQGQLVGWVPQGGQGPRPWRRSAHPGPASHATSNPHRFKESVQTLGHVDSFGRVHCVSPLLYETGRIPFTLSMDNGRSFPRSGTWLAGEPHLTGPGCGHQAPHSAGPVPHPPTMGTFPSTNLCTPGPPTGS